MPRSPRPGPKKVTVTDIARELSVSTATVSYVLSGGPRARVSEETRKAVLETAERLGYRRNQLAVALRSGRTRTIGIACPLPISSVESLKLNFYIKDLYVALTLACSRRDLGAMGFFSTEGTPADPRALAERRVDGIVTVSAYSRPEWVREVSEMGIPLVEVGTGYGPHQVHAANFDGARTALDHLFELGHRRIAHLSGDMKVRSALDRFRGYDAFCQTHGLESIVRRYTDGLPEMLESPFRPTAIFCYDDDLAMHVLEEAQRRGIDVPDQLSVVGFNDDPRDTLTLPPLTTVAMPLDGMAEAALSILDRLIAGEDVPSETVPVPTRLVVRRSTAPPPADAP